MTAPSFALILGLFYAGFGLLGALPSLSLPGGAPDPGFGYFLGLFRVNGLLDALHFVLGFWGLVAWSGALSAITYARSASILLGLAAVGGLLPAAALHALPLQGHNIWLHALSAVAAAYVGWRSLARRRAPAHAERRRGAPERRRAARPVVLERRNGRFDRRELHGSTFAAG